MLLLVLHGVVLVWLWQIRQSMNTPAKREPEGKGHDEDTEVIREDTEGSREPTAWYVSDQEQAQQELELIRLSQRRAAEVSRWR